MRVIDAIAEPIRKAQAERAHNAELTQNLTHALTSSEKMAYKVNPQGLIPFSGVPLISRKAVPLGYNRHTDLGSYNPEVFAHLNTDKLVKISGQELKDVFDQAKSDFVPAGLSDTTKDWFRRETKANDLDDAVTATQKTYENRGPNVIQKQHFALSGRAAGHLALQTLYKQTHKELVETQGKQIAAIDKLFEGLDTDTAKKSDVSRQLFNGRDDVSSEELADKKRELVTSLETKHQEQLKALNKVLEEKQNAYAKDDLLKKELGLAALRAMLTEEQLDELRKPEKDASGAAAAFSVEKAANEVDPRLAKVIKDQKTGTIMSFKQDEKGAWGANAHIDKNLTGKALEREIDAKLDMMQAAGCTWVSMTTNRTQHGKDMAVNEYKMFYMKAKARGLEVKISDTQRNVYNPDTDVAMQESIKLLEKARATINTPALADPKKLKTELKQAFKDEQATHLEEAQAARRPAPTPTR